MTIKEKYELETAIVTEWDGTEEMVFYREVEGDKVEMTYAEGIKGLKQTVTRKYFEKKLQPRPVIYN